ncbi:MAG: tetratricopeptide repeat protein [Thermoplasmata archaeon]
MSLGIHAFLAFYMAFKTVFILWNATSLLERWAFELTPLFLLQFPELQLLFVGTGLAAGNAFLHYSRPQSDRLISVAITTIMVVSLILALRTSPYYFDAINIPRLIVLGALLVTVPMDHLDLLRRRVQQPAVHAPPEVAMWGPEPEAFDEGLGTLDEALNALDEVVGGVEPTPAEATDVAASMLEGLLADFDEPETGVEASEVRRRQAIFDKRMKSIDNRLAADAEDVDALFAKATYLAMRKEYEKAIDLLDQVGAVKPDYPGLWIFKAKIYELMGNLKMAELSLERASQQEE